MAGFFIGTTEWIDSKIHEGFFRPDGQLTLRKMLSHFVEPVVLFLSTNKKPAILSTEWIDNKKPAIWRGSFLLVQPSGLTQKSMKDFFGLTASLRCAKCSRILSNRWLSSFQPTKSPPYGGLFYWYNRVDSNHRPPPCQGGALTN